MKRALYAAWWPAEGQSPHLLPGGDPARYQHLAANCRRAAPRLSWQHEERELLRLWAGVVPVEVAAG